MLKEPTPESPVLKSHFIHDLEKIKIFTGVLS